MSEIYNFFRKADGEEWFYPLWLYDDEEAKENAEYNPGTTKVENIWGRIIWGAND